MINYITVILAFISVCSTVLVKLLRDKIKALKTENTTLVNKLDKIHDKELAKIKKEEERKQDKYKKEYELLKKQGFNENIIKQIMSTDGDLHITLPLSK